MSDSWPSIFDLEEVLAHLERIPRRFAKISVPSDFKSSDDGQDQLDAICMILIAAGEMFKNIDKKTTKQYLPRYPDIDWKRFIGLRDVMAHNYADVDAEQIFFICRDNIPPLIETVRRMIGDIAIRLPLENDDVVQ